MHTPCCKPFRRNLGNMLAATVPLTDDNTRRVMFWEAERQQVVVSVQFDIANAPGAGLSLAYRFIRADEENARSIFTAVGGDIATSATVIANQRNQGQTFFTTGAVGIELRNGFDVAIGNVEVIVDIIPAPVTERGPNPQSW